MFDKSLKTPPLNIGKTNKNTEFCKFGIFISVTNILVKFLDKVYKKFFN